MKIKNTRIFPYPVLSSMYDDYINCNFGIDVKAKKGKKRLYVEILPTIESKTISSLIQNNNAEIIAHLECGRTRYRTTKKLKLNELSNFEIPNGDLSDDLEVIAFVVARKDISNFGCSNNEFNSDYGNTTFEIENGSILAISNQKDIPVPKDIFDLSNVNSIVSIISKQDDDTSRNIDINLTDKKIRVILPKDTYIDYSGIGKTENKYTPILHSMFVFPALVYALDYLKSMDDDKWIDVENYLWFKVIKKKVEELHGQFDKKIIEKYSSVIIAQELIENPFPVAVNTLLGMEAK